MSRTTFIKPKNKKSTTFSPVSGKKLFGRTDTRAWIKLGKQAEKDYDDQTDHGMKQKKQASWEKDIKSGLKAYDLKKSATPAASTP